MTTILRHFTNTIWNNSDTKDLESTISRTFSTSTIHTSTSTYPNQKSNYRSNQSNILLMSVQLCSRRNLLPGSSKKWTLDTKKSKAISPVRCKWIHRCTKIFKSQKRWAVSKTSILFVLKFVPFAASKGVSANLLCTGSKRRRTKQQITDEKEATEKKAL